jgi:hypothetical protein
MELDLAQNLSITLPYYPNPVSNVDTEIYTDSVSFVITPNTSNAQYIFISDNMNQFDN